MAQLDERARHELYIAFENQIGPKNTETLMSMLPPAGWADVATKQDLALLRNEFRADFADFRTEMRTEFAEFRTDMRTEMRTELSALRVEFKNDLAAWGRALVFSLGGLAISLTAVLLTAIALID